MPYADIEEKRARDRAYGNERREERAARAKAWREKSRENRERQKAHSRRSHLKRYFGLTVQEYEDLLATQGDACAICGGTDTLRGRSLCVDHDHSTGAVRGILCHRCNVCIAQARDDASILRRAVAYLERAAT